MKLPPHLPKNLRTRANFVLAYTICLDLEKGILEETPSSKMTERHPEKSLVLCRILGFLLLHIPTDVGRENVALEIQCCGKDRGSLLKLGEMYLDCFIRPFWSDAERTPSFSSPDDDYHHTFSKVVDVVEDLIENYNVPENHNTAKTHALCRDGFRCVISNTYDTWAVGDIQEIREKYLQNPPGGLPCMPTLCMHILPDSLDTCLSTDSINEKDTTSVWTILESFGFTGIQEEFKIHRHHLYNVISLRGDFFEYFEKLAIWFTPTESPNKYKLEKAPYFSWAKLFPEFVTFETPNQDKFPLPSPVYLAIHATCAKVASHSDASRYIDSSLKELGDNEDIRERLRQEIISSFNRPVVSK